MASCLLPRVVEPVPLGSLGGQSVSPKELSSFIGGFRALPGGASFYHKTDIFIIIDFIVSIVFVLNIICHLYYCILCFS